MSETISYHVDEAPNLKVELLSPEKFSEVFLNFLAGAEMDFVLSDERLGGDGENGVDLARATVASPDGVLPFLLLDIEQVFAATMGENFRLGVSVSLDNSVPLGASVKRMPRVPSSAVLAMLVQRLEELGKGGKVDLTQIVEAWAPVIRQLHFEQDETPAAV